MIYLQKLGVLAPLVWEEIKNGQTVHKGLAKILYRDCLCTSTHPGSFGRR
jgi:hypothetical protein